MRNFSGDIPKMKKGGKELLIVLTILLIMFGVYVYNTRFYVIIRFDELGPLTKNMTAYYNGFKIGYISHIGSDRDFKHTLVRVNLINRDINLPQNTTVSVERFLNGELYLQFRYPQSPSLQMIKRGDILEGMAPYSLEQFMMGQSISGMSDVVSLHIIKALNSADAANQEMKVFFQITSKLIHENGRGIRTSVNNTVKITDSLAQMAENLNQTSKKLNKALDEETLKSTSSNIKDTTSNIKETTENISKATKDIDKTMKRIDDTMSHVNETAQNLNSITSGLNETLGKRFGGMRLMFGTPVRPKNQ